MTVEQLSPSEVASRLAGDDPPTLLDVRTRAEHALAAVDGAVWIPLDQLSARHFELERDTPIVVMCHHGIRSMHAAMFLSQRGFERVDNMRGGIEAWSREVDPSVPRY